MQELVVVPTYNEAENLAPLVEQLLSLTSTLHVLVVDDGSPDGTGELADDLARQSERVHVVHRPGKLGLGSAYVAGFRFGLARDFQLIVEMDADFSHRPEDLPRLLAAAHTADVVIGSRQVAGGEAVGWSPLRRIVSFGGSLYARKLLGLPVRDCTSGFKCFRRRAIEALDLDAIHSSGFGFQVEVNYACACAGLRLTEVPIVFPDRVRGASKMSSRIFAEAMWLVLALRLGFVRTPLRKPDRRTTLAAAERPVSL